MCLLSILSSDSYGIVLNVCDTVAHFSLTNLTNLTNSTSARAHLTDRLSSRPGTAAGRLGQVGKQSFKSQFRKVTNSYPETNKMSTYQQLCIQVQTETDGGTLGRC